MAKKQKENFTTKSGAELAKLLLEFQAKLWQSKADLLTGKAKNAKEVRSVKKDIARVLTAMNAAPKA